MKSPRFLIVLGVGRGAESHPAWPDVHQAFSGELDSGGSWVSWRLTGGNHRELGRSTRVFATLADARDDAARVRDRIGEASPFILTTPHAGTWTWRLRLDDVAVATASRGYSRYRECAYNVEAFIAATTIATLPEGGTERRRVISLEDPKVIPTVRIGEAAAPTREKS